MLWCYEQQSYDDRYLLILDDAGQYCSQRGDRWIMLSVDEKFATLGEKRNAAISLLSRDCEYVSVWDDDDLYFSNHLATQAKHLGTGFTVAKEMLVDHGEWIERTKTHGHGFHSGWAYQRSLFLRKGGYPAKDVGEDAAIYDRLKEYKQVYPGFTMVYGWQQKDWHISTGVPELPPVTRIEALYPMKPDLRRFKRWMPTS
jgi:hypothetical protein